MAKDRKIGADDSSLPIGPMDQKTYMKRLKALDLSQKRVEETAEEAKSARSAHSLLLKDFKKDGGNLDALRDVIRMRKMDEGDLIAHEETRARYATWMRLAVGTQADLPLDHADHDDGDEAETGPGADDKEWDAAAPRTGVETAPPPSPTRRRGAGKPPAAEIANTTNSPMN